MVNNTSFSNAGDVDSISGQGTKFPHASSDLAHVLQQRPRAVNFYNFWARTQVKKASANSALFVSDLNVALLKKQTFNKLFSSRLHVST